MSNKTSTIKTKPLKPTESFESCLERISTRIARLVNETAQFWKLQRNQAESLEDYEDYIKTLKMDFNNEMDDILMEIERSKEIWEWLVRNSRD